MEQNIKRKDRDEIRPQKRSSVENANGLKNVAFFSTREQKNVHTVYVKTRLCVILGVIFMIAAPWDSVWILVSCVSVALSFACCFCLIVCLFFVKRKIEKWYIK